VSEADADLAKAWLANERLYSGRLPDDNSVPPDYDFAIEGQVSELIREDADPDRAAKLIDQMLEAARDEDDLSQIGVDPLENLLRYHGAVEGRQKSIRVVHTVACAVLICSRAGAGPPLDAASRPH
jgi:hypothetical protein